LYCTETLVCRGEPEHGRHHPQQMDEVVGYGITKRGHLWRQEWKY
jgi:hypothetical protein